MGIGFFAPLPLAMMLPFMAGQSMIMGESFGKGFQYGKRKISSMSNEEFNKMDANQLGRELATDYTQIIPHLEQAVRASSDFQNMIIQELIKIIPNFVDQLLGGNAPPESGGGSRLPPAGIPAFLTPIIGPPPQTILENPQINPPAVTTPGLNAIEQWASRWIKPPSITQFSSITIPEARYLLNEFSKGNLGKQFLFARTSLIKKWEALEQEKIDNLKTPEQAIAASGATGIVKQIATMYAELQGLINRYKIAVFKEKGGTSKPLTRNAMNAFLNAAKKYNQFVAVNRKSNLQIDTAKSLQAKKLIPK